MSTQVVPRTYGEAMLQLATELNELITKYSHAVRNIPTDPAPLTVFADLEDALRVFGARPSGVPMADAKKLSESLPTFTHKEGSLRQMLCRVMRGIVRETHNATREVLTDPDQSPGYAVALNIDPQSVGTDGKCVAVFKIQN